MANKIYVGQEGAQVLYRRVKALSANFATAEQGAKADTAYQKPVDGIPKSDLDSVVQASLDKADTALQDHQDISGKADKVSPATEGNLASLDATGNLVDSGVSSGVLASKAGADGGTDLSLVTTGEKYVWNDWTSASVENLWTEHLGKGFAAKQADYAIRASEDVNGTSLTLTVDSESDTVTHIGGKKISAKTAETDINGKSLELTILNNERVTQIGGLTVGADAPDLTNYYHHRGSSNLNVSLGNNNVGKLIQTNGDMNSDNVTYSIQTDWGGVIRTLFEINTTSANSSYFTFGLDMSNNGRRYLLPQPVANKYARTNANGQIVWGDAPESLPSSSASDENKVLRVNDEGNPVWSQMTTGTFGSLTDEDSDEIQDDDGNSIGDENSVELWTSFNGIGFGAERAVADEVGNNIKVTYATKEDLNSALGDIESLLAAL